MCGFQDALCNILPMDWLDPYGRTPFANDAEMSVDITIVETDDGIRATSVKNPPTSSPSRLMDAIKQALGVDFLDDGPQNGSQRSADLGKRSETKSGENVPQTEEPDASGTMKSTSPGPSKQGSQPWGSGKPPEEPSREDDAQEKDAKEKAPRFK